MAAAQPIEVGVVGLRSAGLAWHDVAARTRGRAVVKALWDAVPARLDVAIRSADSSKGAEWGIPPHACRSLKKMAERRSLRAAIVLDPGWAGLWAARRIADEGTPVLWLAEWPHAAAWSFQGIGRDLIVPGLLLRYCPATLRLRELLATELSTIETIAIEAANGQQIWELADWFSCVAGSPIGAIAADGEALEVSLKNGMDCRIQLGEKTAATVSAAKGVAVWGPPDSLLWSSSSERPIDHSMLHGETGHGAVGKRIDMSQDRPALDVLLDLFLRRTIGGLVPVPSVDAVIAAVGF